MLSLDMDDAQETGSKQIRTFPSQNGAKGEGT